MKNKELIKELEACGFVIGSLDILSKKLDNKYLCEYRVPTEELWISQDRSVLFTKMHQTFAQIAEKVLELTGVTLTPKPTKAVNEKLIKELKGFGFRANTKESLRLVFEGMRFMYWNNKVDVLTAGPNGKYVETVKVFNVDQIQDVVMEHTAKYLTPKQTKRQTKRQEIDTLRESVKMLDKENHEMGVYIAKNEKENQELGKRIEALEKNTPLFFGMDFGLSSSETAITVIRNQGGSLFAKKITESEIESGDHVRIVELNEKSEWELNEICKVLKVSGFMVLLCKQNYKHEKWFKLDQVTKDLGGAPEQKEPIVTDSEEATNSEPEKTEGVFKVGDPVVLNPTIDFPINSIKLEAAAQTVFTVSGTNTNCFYLSKNGKPFFKDILFYQCELLNAPIKRIFETGNRVVVKPRNTYAFGCSDSKRNMAKCSTILIIQDICGNNSVAGGLEIETNDGRYTVGELQHAPKEAAKVLKIGVTVETFYSVGKAGQRVLIVSQSDLDNEPLCTTKAPKEAAKANSVSLEDYQNAYRCACDLLTLLDEKYHEGGVIPLDSVEGVISQIDNVVAGLEKRKEAAKVLEFGGWAETLYSVGCIKIGERVLISSQPDADGEWLCTSGEYEDSEYYKPEDLKAL
jgi:hypothetical protein